MAYGNALKLKANALLSLTEADFPVTAVYGLIGNIKNIARLIHIQNFTDVTILFSFDGVNDHDILLPNTFLLLDIASNQSEMGGLYLPDNQPIYARYLTGSAPTVNAVYVASFYGYNGE